MVTASDVADLAGALAWPVLAGALLIVYRKSLRSIATEFGKRMTGLGIGPISFQFAVAKGGYTEKILGGIDFGGKGISGFQSGFSDLLNQIKDISPLDYVVVSLGSGENWLTSRLYVFSLILQRLRSLRYVVFVYTRQDVKHHFLGFADPCDIAYALSNNYPWLEHGFHDALSLAQVDKLSSSTAVQVITSYLNNVHVWEPKKVVPEREFVQLDANLWEHAVWLDASGVERILGNLLKIETIQKKDLVTLASEQQSRMILSAKSEFIAMLTDDGRMDNMIDRKSFVERIAQGALSNA